MAIIDQYRSIITVVLEWEVGPQEAPERAQALKELYLNEAKLIPGYISTNLHITLDQTKIINYGQWKSEEDFENFIKSEAALKSGFFDPLPRILKMKVSYAS